MDVRMPETDGIEATRRITAREPAPKILVLTTFDLDDVVYEALRAGASGFLLKDAPEERLTTAIRVVADGGSGDRVTVIDPTSGALSRRRFLRHAAALGVGSYAYLSGVAPASAQLFGQSAGRSVAVIGGGVTGMTATYELAGPARPGVARPKRCSRPPARPPIGRTVVDA
jgi:DNA-binding NarL/FixJ family response regulator